MEGAERKQGRGALLVANLPSLQNLLKRDPKAYRDDFVLQWNQYQSLRKIVELGIDTSTSAKARETEQRWRELVTFVAQVASCYPDITAEFPSHLSTLLLQSNAGLSPETRKTLIQSLVLLRNRDMLPSLELLKILFPLLGVTSSPNLRSFILKTILNDIRNGNAKAKNHKLNRTVQGLLFSMVERGVQQLDGQGGGPEGTGARSSRKQPGGVSSATAAGREAMLAVKMASELWRKNIWNDAKTVQLVSLACFHSNTKVASAAMHFFLATEDDTPPDSDEENNEPDLPDFKQMYHQSTINKSRRSTQRKEKKTVRQTNNKRKRLDAKKAAQANFAALHLLLDPQTFAERLYDHMVKFDRQYTLEHRVLMMQLFGRVTGTHQCTVLGFYSYATRFLNHHQQSVTSILVAVAQSVHELTPPDVLTPVIRKLASEFVHPGVSPEVIAAGLNAIREVCRRQPLGMDRDLLEDLVDYKKSRDKGIMMASRSLLQLYREVDPSLLRRRERGKVASMSGKDKEQLKFGYKAEGQGIAGLDLLAKHMADRRARGVADDEQDEEAKWAYNQSGDEDDDDESEDGWIAVSSDDEQQIHLSDSDDASDSEDEGKSKRRKKQDKKSAASRGDDQEIEEEVGEDEEEPITFNLIDDSDEDDENEDEDEDEDEEDEDDEADAADEEAVNQELARLQNLAAEQILTPADFAKMNELQTAAAEEEAKNGGGSAARRKLQALAAAKKAAQSSEFLTESEILGQRKKPKADYEERMASIAKGREGRDKFGSSKGKRLGAKSHSTTNDEKRRGKNFMMARQSRAVRTKKAASLKDRSKRLKGHIDKQKKRKK